MTTKLLNPADQKTRRGNRVISARRAADYLKLAHNTFFKAMAAGWIKPQATIEGERNAFGFETKYLDQVDQVLPDERVKGQLIFTPEVRKRLLEINDKWSKNSQR